MNQLSYRIGFVVLLVATVVLAGCKTTLSVRRATDDTSRVGAPYSLMFTQYQIEVTRQVVACSTELKALVKADIKKSQGAPDPRQSFTLDTNSLSSTFKTSSVKVGYSANQGISTLNASAESHESAVIANVIGGIVKVATIAALAGSAPLVAGKQQACSDNVLKAVGVVKTLGPQVDAASKVVDALTEETKALNAKAAALGSNADDATKSSLSKKYDELARANAGLKGKTAQLDKALKAVTYTETTTWPRDGDNAEEISHVQDVVFKQWGMLESDLRKRAEFDVDFKLEALGDHGRKWPGDQVVQPELGVPIRLPEPGVLKICAGGPCASDNPPIATMEGDVLQLGNVYYLPCTSRSFSSIECSLELTDTGQIKSIGTVNKVATAEAATGAAKDALGQLADLQTTLSTVDTKKLEAKTAALKAEADYAAAVAALAPDPGKADKDATAVLQSQTDLLNAKVSELEAEDALRGAMSNAGKTP